MKASAFQRACTVIYTFIFCIAELSRTYASGDCLPLLLNVIIGLHFTKGINPEKIMVQIEDQLCV